MPTRSLRLLFLESKEPSWEERLTGLEAGLSRLQQSLDRFVSGAGKATLPRERGEARGSAVPGAPGLGAPKLPGLDPAVVAAARQAGIPEEQLAKMSQLVTIGGGAARRGRRRRRLLRAPLL